MHLLKMPNTTFVFCPSLTALREILFASAAHCWEIDGFPRLILIKRKIDWLLNGVPGIAFQLNVDLFHSVQSFISQSNRFS